MTERFRVRKQEFEKTNATTTATQFYFNENLLPSENMSIQF